MRYSLDDSFNGAARRFGEVGEVKFTIRFLCVRKPETPRRQPILHFAPADADRLFSPPMAGQQIQYNARRHSRSLGLFF